MQVLFPLFPYPNDNINGAPVWEHLSIQRTAEYNGQVRVDQNFSAKDSFFTRYTIDDTSQNRPGVYTFINDIWSNRSQYVTLSETHVFSSQLLNQARLSFSWTWHDRCLRFSRSRDCRPWSRADFWYIAVLQLHQWVWHRY